MKKVLKLICLLAVIFALSVSVFADSPTETTVPSEVAGVTGTTDAPSDVNVEIKAPDAAMAGQNKTVLQVAAGDGTTVVIAEFDIIVTKDGEQLHEGVNTTVTVSGLGQYIGKTVVLIEDGVVKQSKVITGDSASFVINTYSTYTVAVVDTPVPAATAPQTSQTVLPYALIALAALAIVVAMYAKKRSFN